MNVDMLVVGAHPDDAELGVGGTIRKLTRRGFKVAILDLTQGEMSSRGTIEERRGEARQAAEILECARANAALPDGELANTTEQQRRIIPFIRTYRPKILLTLMYEDRHPDHVAAHHLVKDANFFSGLVRIETGQEPYRAPIVYYYYPYYDDAKPPHLVMDISAEFESKLEAIRAHRSQFFNPDYEGRATHISSPRFWDAIRHRAAYWGNRINVDYGEPLYSDGPVGVSLPPGLGETL